MSDNDEGQRSTIEWIVYFIGVTLMLPVTLFMLIFRFNPLTAIIAYVGFFGGLYFFLKGY